jgi:prevent-host-death family protein
MASHVVNVTEFKAKCLALIEEVSTKGGTITVTKRGQPVVTLNPVKNKKYKSPMGLLAGQLDGFEEDLDAARAEWREIQEKKWENGI